MKRIKKYNGEDNSFVDEEGRSAKSKESSGPLTPAQRVEFSEATGSTGPAKSMSFKEAFASARGAGDKTFEWRGKKYTTDLASSKPATKPAAEKAAAKPAEKLAEPVKKIESASAPLARSIKSDVDELAKSKASMGMVNMLPSGRMSPQKREEVIKPTPKRSNYTAPNAFEFTDMGSMQFAGGGKIRSASSRADGIAIRGKTRA